MSKFLKSSLSLSLMVILLAVIPLRAEYIFLKDGTIIKCKIVSETRTQITCNDEKNVTQIIPQYSVLRVLYTEINMGKMNVQMKSGESFKAYMVDEDRDFYIFRNDITKPEEFKIKRTDVLFLAERNPSALKGDAELNSISLAWYSPFDKMEKFNVYVKRKKEDKYAIADTSKKNSYTLRDLPSNTKFFIKVTGVDSENVETLPSNEITVTTLNRAPFFPVGLKETTAETGETILEWGVAKDPDGVVVKYRIYAIKNNKKNLIVETKDNSYKISKTESIDRLLVSAVDDLGAESDALLTNKKDIFRVFISPAVMFPIDIFTAMSDFGYGGMVSFMAQNIFVNGFTPGLEFGYFYSPEKDSLSTDGQNVHGMNFITGTVKAGYTFKVNEYFFINPAVSFGAAYIDYTYTARDLVTLVDTKKSARGFDPMGAVSLSLDFILTDYFFIGINGSYGLLFENAKVFQFALCGINLGVRF